MTQEQKRKISEDLVSTEKLKEMRIEYKDNSKMRIDIDLLLLGRIGEEALVKFWKDNNL